MPSLDSLRDELREPAEWFFQQVREAFPGFVITSARRSWQDQERLYERFRAGDPSIPLALAPGSSMHERGLAWDMARIGHDPKTDEVLAYVGDVWRQLGGHWAGPTDPVHFEGPKAWRDIARRYDLR